MKSDEHYAGYESMSEEIRRTGWERARDRFNESNPPGQPWTGSTSQLKFAHGEFDALFANMKYPPK